LPTSFANGILPVSPASNATAPALASSAKAFTSNSKSISSTDSVAQAKSTISLNGLENFCSTLLGYSGPYVTKTVYSAITQTSLMTTKTFSGHTTETEDVTVELTHTVSYPAHTVTITPGVTATIEATTIDTVESLNIVTTAVETISKVPKLRVRQANDTNVAYAPEVPAALRVYGPGVLSSACSDFLGPRPPVSTLNKKDISTIVQTSFATGPNVIFSPTVTISKASTISHGQTFTKTVSPSTQHASGTKTLTTTFELTLTSTALITEM